MLMKTCTIEGCTNEHAARGWCMKHYKRWPKYGDPTILKTVSYVQDPTKTPTDIDIAWAAGFLEGEGHFDLGNQSKRASATQVTKEPLAQLQDLFGGSLRLHKKSNPNHNDCWYWVTCGQRAVRVMTTVYPHMSTRRKLQIDNVLTA